MESVDRIGRYQVVGELGTGAMSRVYLAHDPNLDRKVAVKIVFTNLTLDGDAQEDLQRRFLLEARAAGKLNHPGIVRVYDADTDAGTGVPYIAMEWVQGRSLRSVLEERGQVPVPMAAAILRQIAEALDHAHRHGRIHRDIKPSNILLSRSGRAKISDFGVAKIVSEPYTLSGQILGTPLYMSPEQVKDEPIDGRSDLFSLGVVLYQCVTGERPFSGDSLAKVVYKILHTDPRPPKLDRSEGSQLVSQVIQQALHKDPAARFQTGAEFARSLKRVESAYESDLEDSPEPLKEWVATLSEEISTPDESGDFDEEDSSDVPSTWQLTTGEINQVIESGSGVELGSLQEPSIHAPVGKTYLGVPFTTRRLIGMAIWIVLLAAMTAVVVRRNSIGPNASPVGEQNPDAQTATIDDQNPEETSARSVVQADSDPSTSQPLSRDLPETGPSSTRQVSPSAAPTTPPSQQRASADDQSVAVDPSAAQRVETAVQDEPIVVVEKVPVPIPTAMVEVVYKNRLRDAEMTILVDGQKVWERHLALSSNFVRKVIGKQVKARIAVPEGYHQLRIRVNSPSSGINAAKTLRARFQGGQARQLQVILDLNSNDLRLIWKE